MKPNDEIYGDYQQKQQAVSGQIEHVVMCDDCAVFRYDYEGCDERLTTWMPEDEAAKLRDSKTYFADDAKYILRKVNT